MGIGTIAMISTATIYSPTGESRTLEANAAAREVRKDPTAWSFTKPPPIGWHREVPKYRVTIQGGVYPSPNNRFRFEPPFASCSDNNVWQYATRPYDHGEIIETREWPHASFHPLNYAAEKVLDYFSRTRSSRSPRVRCDCVRGAKRSRCADCVCRGRSRSDVACSPDCRDGVGGCDRREGHAERH